MAGGVNTTKVDMMMMTMMIVGTGYRGITWLIVLKILSRIDDAREVRIMENHTLIYSLVGDAVPVTLTLCTSLPSYVLKAADACSLLLCRSITTQL